MNQQSGHVTDAQIDRYLGSSDRDLGPEDPWVDRHFSECWHCLERAIQTQRTQLGFLKVDEASTEVHPGCPEEYVIESLAAGACPSETACQVIHHVAGCDYCGPLLKRHHEELSENFTPSEDAFLDGLKTSTPEWEQQLVRRYIRKSTWRRIVERARTLANRFPPPGIWRWVPVGALATAVVVTGVIELPVVLDRMAQKKVKTLAIQALCDQPTLEMRIPHGCYAPFQKQMGNSAGQPNESLLEAERILAHKEKAGPLDREWLQSEGLAYLVAGTPGSASRASLAFEKARHEGLNDPSLEIELAASYFESDQVPKTIDLLEGVLKRSNLSLEEREIALYDLAIAYETIQAWALAVDRWEAYLKLDPSSDWAKDAKIRRDKAKARIPSPNPQGRITSPPPDDPTLRAHMEEYLDNLRYWLPEAVEKPQSNAALASRRLAEVLQDHSDPWLRDLLNRTLRDQLSTVNMLGKALTANKQGRYYEAAKQAQDAAISFARQHNVPGELLAQFEQVYASQRNLEPVECAAQAQHLWNELSRTNYRWLQGQVALEKATCLNLNADLNDATRELAASAKIAQDSDFPVLHLRILGLSAGIERLQNRPDQSWRKAVQGLRICSEQVCPSERLYQFYSVLEQYAQKEHFPHMQEALLRQAIAIREMDPPEDRDTTVEGALYGRLNIVALVLKEEILAAEASQNSNQLLSHAPNDPTTNKYVLAAKVDQAELQLQLGDAKAAIATLEPARERVPHIAHEFVALKFYLLLGEAYRQVGKLEEAAASFEAGIVIAEKALSTLTNESDRLEWVSGSDPVYRGLALVLLDQGHDVDALRVWEWYGSRSLRDERAPSEISWNELQKEIFSPLPVLATDTRLIYASFQDRLQIWAMNTKGIKASRIKIKQADLETEVSDFALQCATPPNPQAAPQELRRMQDELHKMARALNSLFLDPVRSEFESSPNVIVELDPRLSRLPIAALISPNGRYFAQDHAITGSPGMFWEKKLRQPELVRTDAALLLVQGSGHLPGQEELRDTIRSVFLNTTFLTPEKAPWATVSRELKSHQVFVFIGHGLPEKAGTSLVYGDTRVGVRQLSSDVLGHLQLAVLEACSSGAGGENGPLETDNLVHSFLSAAVPIVIASRWDLDSQSTADLLISFMKHLGQDGTVSQAMYHARNDSFTVRNHPYYWAGLDLVGRLD